MCETLGLNLFQLQDVDVNAFLQNPTFVMAIGDIIRSFKNQVNAKNNDGEDDGEDENNYDAFRDDYDKLRRRIPPGRFVGETPAGCRNINRDDVIFDDNDVLGTTGIGDGNIRDDNGLLAMKQLRRHISDDMSSQYF
ncbi:unnamed protein product [Lactuca saligna]|uniref:Uncharacterized protein n=1 Tax=Lactuca saligna TaxID=75948 RepID=A0AA36EBZ3_LACSI|nr:unnamed protein product [Lactuca saligna]